MIEIVNFTKYYGDNLILRNVSFNAEEGKTTVIIGKSGCGKSTLLRHIASLENDETGHTEGSITLKKSSGDIEVSHLKEKDLLKEKIRGNFVGMLFQNSALFDFLNVRGNLLWAMEENMDITRSEMDDIMADCLKMVDIDISFLDRDVSTLSGGERKRVALARALVLDPKIILYDEPTTGLDPPTAAGINRMIKRLRDVKKITSVVTTHDMLSAGIIADKIVMIENNEVKFTGTYQEARENPDVKNFVETGLSREHH